MAYWLRTRCYICEQTVIWLPFLASTLNSAANFIQLDSNILLSKSNDMRYDIALSRPVIRFSITPRHLFSHETNFLSGYWQAITAIDRATYRILPALRWS